MKPIDVPLCDLAFLLIKYSTWTLSSSLIYWPFTIVLWQVARYPYKGTLLRSWRLDGKFFFFFLCIFECRLLERLSRGVFGKDSYNWSRFWFIGEGIGIFYFWENRIDVWNLNTWPLIFELGIFEFWSFRI